MKYICCPQTECPMRNIVLLIPAIAAILILFGSLGCTSTAVIARPELAGVRQNSAKCLSELSVGFLTPESDAQGRREPDDFIGVISRAGIFKKVAVVTGRDTWPDLLVADFRDSFPENNSGFQCFKPYLNIVSAGPVPAVCSCDHRISFDVSSSRINRNLKI